MSETRVKQHPKLGVLVCTDGHVMVPQNYRSPARWTFGSRHSSGYRQVRIDGKAYLVHRLIAETFIGPIPEGYEIDHISRDKSANMLSNLRCVTHSENQRNTSFHDRVEARGGTHRYEDARAFNREQCTRYRTKNREKILEYHASYYAENKDKVLERQAHYYSNNKNRLREQQAQYYQAKCNTHRNVRFADGSKHWLPLEEALELLKIPVNQRIFKG